MSNVKLTLVHAARYGSPLINDGEPIMRGESVTVDEGTANKVLRATFTDKADNVHTLFSAEQVKATRKAASKKTANTTAKPKATVKAKTPRTRKQA